MADARYVGEKTGLLPKSALLEGLRPVRESPRIDYIHRLSPVLSTVSCVASPMKMRWRWHVSQGIAAQPMSFARRCDHCWQSRTVGGNTIIYAIGWRSFYGETRITYTRRLSGKPWTELDLRARPLKGGQAIVFQSLRAQRGSTSLILSMMTSYSWKISKPSNPLDWSETICGTWLACVSRLAWTFRESLLVRRHMTRTDDQVDARRMG